ncbi:MAG: DNA-binding protein [Bacteroidales bacterium 36-12]|nr:MAG: DNA-binding protein [Bacteroidales bacterium 36-12]
MNKVLIDTDVILDFFFDIKPFSESASEILTLCESKEIIGFVTPVIVSNVYYLLRQTAKHEKIIEKLTLLISFLEVLITDKRVIMQALSSQFKDFEDALQNFSAEQSSEIDIIVTRNTKDYINSKLSVMLPDDFIKTMNVSR